MNLERYLVILGVTDFPNILFLKNLHFYYLLPRTWKCHRHQKFVVKSMNPGAGQIVALNAAVLQICDLWQVKFSCNDSCLNIVVGGRWAGGFKMGNTCIPMADSCHIWQKPLQYCKVISLQLKCSSVAQSCLTLCDPMNHSTPVLPVHH